MQTFREYVTEYTEEKLIYDIDRLGIMFAEKFKSNSKLLNTLLDTLYEAEDDGVIRDIETQLRCEIDRFDVVVEAARVLSPDQSVRGMLENIVRWLANNGNDPADGLAGNAGHRYDILMKKLER